MAEFEVNLFGQRIAHHRVMLTPLERGRLLNMLGISSGISKLSDEEVINKALEKQRRDEHIDAIRRIRALENSNDNVAAGKAARAIAEGYFVKDVPFVVRNGKNIKGYVINSNGEEFFLHRSVFTEALNNNLKNEKGRRNVVKVMKRAMDAKDWLQNNTFTKGRREAARPDHKNAGDFYDVYFFQVGSDTVKVKVRVSDRLVYTMFIE